MKGEALFENEQPTRQPPSRFFDFCEQFEQAGQRTGQFMLKSC